MVSHLSEQGFQCCLHRINNANVLFPGVACFLIAAITGLFLHASNTDDIQQKMGIKGGHWLTK